MTAAYVNCPNLCQAARTTLTAALQPPVESYRLEAAPCLSETGRLSSGPSALKGVSVMAQIEACSDSQVPDDVA